MPRLVAIGDSLTQGVQSGAVYKTDLSFPALIAEAMGLRVPRDFQVPGFPWSGLPLNIEALLRAMRRKLGSSINPLEWIFELPFLLADFIDDIEDLYERGAGSKPAAYGGIYHNLAVAGFQVYHSYTVNSEICQRQIEEDEGSIEDDLLKIPSASMYRIAQRVLNPKQLNDGRQCWTQIDNLCRLDTRADPVENLILFLGANDCLGTVRDLEVRDMPELSEMPKDCDAYELIRWRDEYNLTSETVFEHDYQRMVDQVAAAISKETNVFVGNLPYVTIPPITQAISGEDDREHNGRQYYTYYGTFFANRDNFTTQNRHLTGSQVRCVDDRIDRFNEIIDGIVKEQRETHNRNWHVVDICSLLNKLAFKRNMDVHFPQIPLHQYLTKEGDPNHPLLDEDLRPTPNVLRFETADSQRMGGGLFSLDCFHPTTIGYGLIAEVFLHKMGNTKRKTGNANVIDAKSVRLNWKNIIERDGLIRNPPVLWDDIIAAAEANPRLADLLYRVLI
ncbi:lipase [Candidatus Poribacteria bacterium]|nr:MAG: lipase [Candidatus Poribacteria bacterium]